MASSVHNRYETYAEMSVDNYTWSFVFLIVDDRISLEFIINDDTVIPVKVGTHDEAYRQRLPIVFLRSVVGGRRRRYDKKERTVVPWVYERNGADTF
jgi:hypothetical protein